MIIYLDLMLPSDLKRQLSIFPRGILNTVLHSGKDFAVSLPMLPSGLAPSSDGAVLFLQIKPSLLAPLGLLQTGVTRYHLPMRSIGKNVRTFLSAIGGAIIRLPYCIIYSKNLYLLPLYHNRIIIRHELSTVNSNICHKNPKKSQIIQKIHSISEPRT